jgi:hypothetical protein
MESMKMISATKLIRAQKEMDEGCTIMSTSSSTRLDVSLIVDQLIAGSYDSRV